jgi:type II secretory pathway predicted ATPase ExeA
VLSLSVDAVSTRESLVVSTWEPAVRTRGAFAALTGSVMSEQATNRMQAMLASAKRCMDVFIGVSCE